MSKLKEDDKVGKFLDLLDKDIDDNPERLTPIKPELFRHANALVSGVDIGEINENLPDDE